MANVIMVQGTMSNAGKSLLVAGLCRVMKQDGYKVAPFKSQNMALNSYVTEDGLEIGRAQVMQAEAAGIKPQVEMNPILLKPTSNMGAQVIVNGKSIGNMPAREYFQYKEKLIPDILNAYQKLYEKFDIIVIEGAGSPAEINLKKQDIVNMGLARMVDAPVLLVGDIDRGGVFAQLYGTVELLEKEERERIKGLIINKFRGDKSILDPGIEMLEDKCKLPVVGVIPYMKLDLDDEDSLSERLTGTNSIAPIDIAVIRLPHISNFTDFNCFERMSQVSLRYVEQINKLGNPDFIILPGTKNTMGDLKWLKETGFASLLQKAAEKNIPIWGICGGYQMLGQEVSDPLVLEDGGCLEGLGLLPVSTFIGEDKKRNQVTGKFNQVEGIFAKLSEQSFTGYEIHMGVTGVAGQSLLAIESKGIHSLEKSQADGCMEKEVYGCYIHGVFDTPEICQTVIAALAEKKGILLESMPTVSLEDYKEAQYNLLAEGIRQHINMEQIYQLMGL